MGNLVCCSVVALGQGAITGNPVLALIHSSSPLNPQAFVLAGDTSGGPPTNYTWRRNGTEISDGGAFSISIAMNGRDASDTENSRYRSTLTVTGRLTGEYHYSVTNRATSGMMTSTFTVQGTYIPKTVDIVLENSRSSLLYYSTNI